MMARSSSVRGPFFFQDRVGHSDLADVVQQGGDLYLIRGLLGNVHFAGDADGPLSKARAVYTGADVFEIEQLIEGADHGIAEGELLLFQFLDAEQEFRCFESRINDESHLVNVAPSIPG